jgi:hypothetical protein
MTVLRPYGLAAYVAFDVAHPGTYLHSSYGSFDATFSQTMAVDRKPTGVDGWFVAVRGDGSVVATSYADNRTNSMGHWVAPAYEGCPTNYGSFGPAPSLPPPTNNSYLAWNRPPLPPCPGYEEPIELPNVVGDSKAEAVAALHKLGLRVAVTTVTTTKRGYDPTKVAGQIPGPGTIGSKHDVTLVFARHVESRGGPLNHG